jgi:hypothetical protein
MEALKNPIYISKHKNKYRGKAQRGMARMLRPTDTGGQFLVFVAVRWQLVLDVDEWKSYCACRTLTSNFDFDDLRQSFVLVLSLIEI